MTPAYPPPPTPWNLPFQSASGSHTSKVTAGWMRPTTRHAPGTGIGFGLGVMRVGGGVNVSDRIPADRIVVSGSASSRSRSQAAASGTVRLAASRSAGIMAAHPITPRRAPMPCGQPDAAATRTD